MYSALIYLVYQKDIFKNIRFSYDDAYLELMIQDKTVTHAVVIINWNRLVFKFAQMPTCSDA